MPAYNNDLFSPPAPLADVTLRNPETGTTVADVLLLVDTGADVTPLPRAVIDRLGIAVADNIGYELEGFDGSTSVAQSVRADLIWQRKTFKGQYLLIDQEIGYLGRDVLNHLSLHLDGPRLNWEIR